MSLNSYIQELVEGRIDFAGQALVEKIAHIVLIATTIVSFIAGFVLQSLTVTFSIFGASTLLLALIVLPPWPMFNAHPVKWLPRVEDKSKSTESSTAR
ncbi:putative microsomal signal peptidase 12 kDa subunit (SPC12) [Lyophyllum shimeji]|uniref:Signal peptidase complex subunit 1 n=1 Tax=Lyophyllum shimeji TaxID=47721 RepID=A0A9P3PWW7_LYOSH|nr:putative microsomal signal peptidase 12 kDa subunit (SPC12) [Lyophyllum shimeji]